MQTLANHAYKQNKPTKQQAQAHIRELYAANPSDQLAALYTYFMPSLPAKARSAAQWVAMACATEQVRQYLCYTYSTGKHLVATDGHRLHLTPTTLAAGFYHPVTGEAITLEGQQFPDYTRIMPSENAALTHIELSSGNPITPAADVVEYQGKWGKPTVCYNIDGNLYNKTYTDAALSWLTAGPIQSTTTGNAIYFTDGTSSALVCQLIK